MTKSINDNVLPNLSEMTIGKCNDRRHAKWVFVTAALPYDFLHLVNLIGSIHKNGLSYLWKIVVYDMGLEQDQKAYLQALHAVNVKTLRMPARGIGLGGAGGYLRSTIAPKMKQPAPSCTVTPAFKFRRIPPGFLI